jgi:hypothetical protein
MKYGPHPPKPLLLSQAALQVVLQKMPMSALLNSHVAMLQCYVAKLNSHLII